MKIKVEMIAHEIGYCGECSEAEPISGGRWRCLLTKKHIPDVWRDIPEWCPLPDKEE